MTALRHPRPPAAETPTYTPTMPGPAMPITNRVCDGCMWPNRCVDDGFCWAAEKRAIAAERGTA